MCEHDCFNCPFPDCLYDGGEDPFSEEYDRKIIRERLDCEVNSAVILGCDTSIKKKRGRPRKSEEVKRFLKKVHMQEYYQAHREDCIARSKAYYEEHKEELLEYQREQGKMRYARKKYDPEYMERKRQREREYYRRRKYGA